MILLEFLSFVEPFITICVYLDNRDSFLYSGIPAEIIHALTCTALCFNVVKIIGASDDLVEVVISSSNCAK